MEFPLLLQKSLELWKAWELRLLVLLSLFLQLTLATQVSRRKSNSKYRFQICVWIMYLLADSIATFTLSILSNRLANIKETKGTTDLKSQITAFWAPFVLLHLGGPDMATAYVLEDNELWLKQLAQLFVQAGLACFIYFMALSGSTLSVLAAGMILVGFIRYAERILCLYLASKDRLRDSMLSLPDFDRTYPRIKEQCTLKKEEGYQVKIDEVTEVPAPVNLAVNSCQACNDEEDTTLVQAYELFEVFKFLFLGFIRNSGDLDASKRIFTTVSSNKAFEIVEIELSCMYDLLYTKVPLLNGAWGIFHWVISLSLPCAVLVFFSLQDKEGYPIVDIYITFLLIGVAIILNIHSLLQAISSDWIRQWQLQRPSRCASWSDVAFRKFHPNQRWSRSVAQFSLLKLSIRRKNWIFQKYQRLAKLDQRLEKNLCIGYKEFGANIKEWIFHHMKETVSYLEGTSRLKRGLASLKLSASEVMKRLNHHHLTWSMEDMEFDQSILIWHVATEVCYYIECETNKAPYGYHIVGIKMSKLVSRYMLYLMLLHPSMLPAGIGVLRYEDTLADIQKSLQQAVSSKNDSSNCNEEFGSRESPSLSEVCSLLLQNRTHPTERKMQRGKNRSVLLDACHLASQLRNLEDRWDLIGKVWAKVLMWAAFQSKGYEHCERLSRGGELLSHVWLLMAHLGIAEPVQTSEAQCTSKLIVQ